MTAVIATIALGTVIAAIGLTAAITSSRKPDGTAVKNNR